MTETKGRSESAEKLITRREDEVYRFCIRPCGSVKTVQLKVKRIKQLFSDEAEREAFVKILEGGRAKR